MKSFEPTLRVDINILLADLVLLLVRMAIIRANIRRINEQGTIKHCK